MGSFLTKHKRGIQRHLDGLRCLHNRKLPQPQAMRIVAETEHGIPTVRGLTQFGWRELGQIDGDREPLSQPENRHGVLSKLHDAVLFALKDPLVLQRLSELGMVPIGNSPEELGTLLKTEIASYEGIVRAAGIERQ